MSASNPAPARPGAALAVSVALLLSGCQWMDTRPEVTITPAGDLVGYEFVDLQVDAGGAPQVQFYVDGKPLWGPFPTGQVIHLDTQVLAKGDHELVARIEQGTSPRVSAPRKLVRVLTQPDLAVRATVEEDPWKPFIVTFRADVPMSDLTIDVTGLEQKPYPFTREIAPDRTSVVVTVEGTLVGLGFVTVRLQARGPDGERGDTTVQRQMPDPIRVDFQSRSNEHVDLLFTPRVPVPGATLVVSDGSGHEFVVGEFGPSPWEVRLPDGTLGSGSRTFEFRRADARLAPSYFTVNLPPGFLTCVLDTVPATLAPGRCARVTNPVPLRSLQISYPDSWMTLTPVSDTEWRLCVSAWPWKQKVVVLTPRLDAVSTTGFPLLNRYDPVSCTFPVAWDWQDPGADPVTDGVAPLRGSLLGVRAITPDVIRLAYLGAEGTPDAGSVHVATRATAGGAFDPGQALNGHPVLDPSAALGDRSAVAWRDAATGAVGALLQDGIGGAWSAWPQADGPGEASEPPALARDASGPTAIAWSERLVDGTTRVRVRVASTGWTDLPSISPFRPGSPIRSVTVAAPTPLGAGVVVAFVEEDLVAARQYATVVSWSGTSWDRINSSMYPSSFFPHSSEPLRLSLAGSPSALYLFLAMPTLAPQVWRWDGPVMISMGGGNGVPGGLHAASAPSDGRDALVAWTVPGTGGATEVRIGPPAGQWGTNTLIATVRSGGVTSLAVDADGMSVAWTTSDGAIHVRTLTP
ncbi:MAG: hypothetical protein WB493_12780 [Anaeromyxobacteraceae bacterium]